jgi:hypothetical protein
VLYELLFPCSLILVTMWHVNVFFELPFSYNSLMLILVYPGSLNLCYHYLFSSVIYLSSEHVLFGTFMSRRALHQGVGWLVRCRPYRDSSRGVCQVYGQYNCALEGPFRFKIFLRIYDLIRRYPDRS